jgi:SAM-dependent methyltransferase
LVEFTGERVIPGQVNPDLWSEHVARYAFARRFAQGRRVLDAGSGAGYGAAELAQTARSVIGIDAATEAVEYARANFSSPGVEFLAASCGALPFANGSFDLVTAFEVIEHLADHRRFLDEAARVLAPDGVFLVSSPNKAYYAESREKTGPNPFHEHEFEAAEFAAELGRVFPSVTLLVQNRVECFAFHPVKTFWDADARIDSGGGTADDAHFLIGICALEIPPAPRSFVYVPKAANLLREREQHVALLEKQLEQTKGWLAATREERDALLNLFREQKHELEAHNRWAEQLNADLQASGLRVAELQQELASEQKAGAAMAAGYEEKLQEMDAENRAKTEWALGTEARLTAELEAVGRELILAVDLLHEAERTVEERTLWAQRGDKEVRDLSEQLARIRASRWFRLGRLFRVGS